MNNLISTLIASFMGFILGFLSIILVLFGFYLWTDNIAKEDSKTKYIKPAIFLISGIISCFLEFYFLFKLGYLIFV